MMIPTIHLNGTSKEALMEQIQNAYSKIHEAERALCEAAPNGRDYYPQDKSPGEQPALYRALDEHFARLQKLRDVMKDLDEILGGIDVQGRR